MSLIDTFLFNGEWDMLALRLRTLDEIVDRFVLVESHRAFSGRPRAWAFDNPPAEFAPWLPRITHVKVTDDPEPGANAWRGHPSRMQSAALLDHQRDAVARGLAGAADDDVVLIADMDEIPDPRGYGRALELLDAHPFVTNALGMYCYWLNALRSDRGAWASGVWTRMSTLRQTPAVGIAEVFSRYRARAPAAVAAGWHFTWQGPLPRIEARLTDMMERQYDNDEYRRLLRAAYAAGVYCGYPWKPDAPLQFQAIDDTFPLPLQRDPQRWAHMIKGVG